MKPPATGCTPARCQRQPEDGDDQAHGRQRSRRSHPSAARGFLLPLCRAPGSLRELSLAGMGPAARQDRPPDGLPGEFLQGSTGRAMTTGTQQKGQQCLLTWAEWWYEQTHWTKWAPKQPDSPHRLRYSPQPRPYLRLPEEPFDLDSFIASLCAEYRGVVRGNQIEWVLAPGAPPATRWAFQFHYDADEFSAITTAVVRVVARTPMQRTNDRKIDALRIAEFKGDPPTEAYLQPLIDGPAHRALARRASRQLEQNAAKHVSQQDDAAIRRFPAKTRLAEEQFATYADILA